MPEYEIDDEHEILLLQIANSRGVTPQEAFALAIRELSDAIAIQNGKDLQASNPELWDMLNQSVGKPGVKRPRPTRTETPPSPPA